MRLTPTPVAQKRVFQDRVSPWWLIGAGLAVSLCCLAFTLLRDHGRDQDVARRAVHDQNARATMIESQIAADLALFDMALREAARTSGPLKIPDYPLFARHAGFINILNEAGDLIADSRYPGAPRPMNFGGREYFQAHRRDRAETARIGAPFATGPGQTPMAPVSRRITTADGAFAGVAIAGVRLSWLREILSRADMAPVTLRREDGTILIRIGWKGDVETPVGTVSPWTGGGGRHAEVMPPSHRFNGLLLELPVNEPSFLSPWLLMAILLSIAGAAPLVVRAISLKREATNMAIAARHAHEERMRLMADMGHELRTPLTSILGQVDFLRHETGMTPTQANHVTRLSDAAGLMRLIVNRVVDVARPGERPITPVLTACALDPLLDSCRGMMEASARAKGLRLTTHVAPGAPRQAMLDRGLVQQILLNLLHNAIKFTTAGAVELRLEGGVARLRFEVADTGPGIPAGKRRRLFHAYDRLDVEDNRIEGVGLGLSITKDLTRRLGGRIGQRDNPGGGSVFWVELPCASPLSAPLDASSNVASATPPYPMSPSALAPREAEVPDIPLSGSGPGENKAADVRALFPTRPLRVLLADDEPMIRDVAAGFLRAAGHAVTEAEDGEAAVRAAREGVFDVLLTDMRMPGCNGLETARRVRALDGRWARVPIVLITADLIAPRPGEAGGEWIDGLLMKPFTRSELLAAIEAAVQERGPDEDDPSRLDEAVPWQSRDSLGVGCDGRASVLRRAADRSFADGAGYAATGE